MTEPEPVPHLAIPARHIDIDDDERQFGTREEMLDRLDAYRDSAVDTHGARLFCPHGEHAGSPCGPCQDSKLEV